MCTAEERKRPPDAIQLPSTVQCSCSCTTSTHHYSNLNFVILFFFLCFWKLWKKKSMYFFPNASIFTIALHIKFLKMNWQLRVRNIFFASKPNCLGKSFDSASTFYSLSNLFLCTNGLIPKYLFKRRMTLEKLSHLEIHTFVMTPM